MNKNEVLVYKLSRKKVIFLFIYYGIILLLGSGGAILIGITLTEELSQIQIIKKSFGISIAVSGMLCSVQYIKRLYKACIESRIDDSDLDKFKQIGNLVYFIFRPLFAFAFSIVMIFMLLSGMFVVTGNLDYILNEKFVYLAVVLSSVLGYSIGKILDKFEQISVKNIVG